MSNDFLQHTIGNRAGMSVTIINYGATIVQCLVPDADGRAEEVTLGFDTPQEYTQPANPYFGCVAGRYANRIARGRFQLGGQTYQLPINNGPNTLHGGLSGFNRKFWSMQAEVNSITLEYISPDGDEGFPGTMTTRVTYTLTENNELKIGYVATTDRPTVVNLTNHAYFNLAPQEATIGQHRIQIDANRYVAVDDNYIPTGQLPDVTGTAMDLRQPVTIDERLPQVEGGFDHSFILNRPGIDATQPAVVLDHPRSRRRLEVFTSQPAVQFYTGNFLDGTLTGRKGVRYPQHAGLCLETQHYPDSPNHSSFPGTVLRPGEQFYEQTIYRFSIH